MSADIIPHRSLAYLATPFSRVPNQRWAHQEACRIAGQLMRSGLHVFCPIAHSMEVCRYGGIDMLDEQFWRQQNDVVLPKCDVLVVAHMKGWDASDGVAHEIDYFTKARKPIWDLDPPSLTMTKRKPVAPVRERYEGLSPDEMRRIANSYLQPDGTSDDRTPAGTVTAPS